MRKILTLSIFCLALLSLNACASSYKEKKAPCPQTAGLSDNPCNPLPINIGFLDQPKKKDA